MISAIWPATEDPRQSLADSADRWLGWGERWPLMIPVFLGLGACLYHALPAEPSFETVAGVACAIFATGALGRLALGHAMVPLLAGSLALGVLAAKAEVDRSGKTLLDNSTNAVALAGTVAAIDTDGRRTRVRLDDVAIEGARRTIRLRLDGSDPYLPIIGDRLAVEAVVFPPPGPVLPGSYDFRRQSYFDNLDGTGVALEPIERLASPQTRSSLARWAAALRLAVADRIIATVERPASSIAIALLTGDRSRMPPEIYDKLRDAGLAHLLAISGLHVGLVAGFFFAMTRLAMGLWPYGADRWNSKKAAAVSGIVAAFAYTVMVGATVPTQRAFVMTALALTAVLLDRWPLSMRLVAVAAVVVMVISPSSVVEPSFQMSFAAVIALIAIYEALTRDGLRRLLLDRGGAAHRILEYAGGVFLTSIIAGLATAPFAIFHFQHLATYGLASNLIAVPLTAFWIMPLGIVALAAMPLGAEMVPLSLLEVGIDLLLDIARLAAAWPYAAITVAKPSVATISLFAGAGLWLALLRGPGRLVGLAPLALGALLIATAKPVTVFVDSRDGTIGVVTDATGNQSRTLWLSNQRLSAYGRDQWLRRGVAEKTRLMPFNARTNDARSDPDPGTDAIRCDGEGCIVRPTGEGPLVAVARTRRALNEDCGIADVVITKMRVAPVPEHCGSTPVIDRSFVAAAGNVAAIVNGGTVAVETVRGYLGQRPWSAWYRSSAANDGGNGRDWGNFRTD